MSKYIQKLREVQREYAPADLEEVTRAIVQTLTAHSDILWERLPDFAEAKKKYSLMTYPDDCLPRLDLLYILGRRILKNEWDINNPADDLHLDALLQCILQDTEEEGCGCLYCGDESLSESLQQEEPTGAQIASQIMNEFFEQALRK